MQKLMICLTKPDAVNAPLWNASIPGFLDTHSKLFFGCSYSIVDDDVLPAKPLALTLTAHPKDAVLSIWVNSAHELADFFEQVSEIGQYQAYGVMESAAIPHQPSPGKVEGMCQIALLKKPKAQSRIDWLEAWLGNHTRIAINTQSTFAYRQNVITVPILHKHQSPPWPLMDAVVEENFPVKAMTSREAFFAAEDSPEKFERHQREMMDSCMKFIDFECFDCVPMSQYIVKSFAPD